LENRHSHIDSIALLIAIYMYITDAHSSRAGYTDNRLRAHNTRHMHPF